MKYYVLSSLQAEDYPISLIGNAVLFESLEHATTKYDYSYFPWYDIEKHESCELPKNGVLVLSDRNLKITIRNIKYNLYVVNEEIKKILSKYVDTNFYEIDVIDENMEEISHSKCYIFKLNVSSTHESFLNLEESMFKFSEGFLVLEKIYSSKSFHQNIFKLKDIDPAQDTIFVSEKVKVDLDKLNGQGFNIYDISLAKWRDPDDFISSLYLDEDEESNELIWPI